MEEDAENDFVVEKSLPSKAHRPHPSRQTPKKRVASSKTRPRRERSMRPVQKRPNRTNRTF
jgi:hypothetical protein